MFQYKLRPYITADSEFVYQTKKNAYKLYVEKFWGSWVEEKQRSIFTDFLEKVQNSLWIIEYKGCPIGIYHGNLTKKDTYEIGNIIIIPAYQGQGIGRHILEQIIKKHQNMKICLRVFKGNSATDFYKKLNFFITGETSTHYVMEHKNKNF